VPEGQVCLTEAEEYSIGSTSCRYRQCPVLSCPVLSCPVWVKVWVCSGDAPWQHSAVRLRGHGKDMGRAYSDLASAGRRMYGVLSS
jgi:hypothetical protein